MGGRWNLNKPINTIMVLCNCLGEGCNAEVCECEIITAFEAWDIVSGYFRNST